MSDSSRQPKPLLCFIASTLNAALAVLGIFMVNLGFDSIRQGIATGWPLVLCGLFMVGSGLWHSVRFFRQGLQVQHTAKI